MTFNGVDQVWDFRATQLRRLPGGSNEFLADILEATDVLVYNASVPQQVKFYGSAYLVADGTMTELGDNIVDFTNEGLISEVSTMILFAGFVNPLGMSVSEMKAIAQFKSTIKDWQNGNEAGYKSTVSNDVVLSIPALSNAGYMAPNGITGANETWAFRQSIAQGTNDLLDWINALHGCTFETDVLTCFMFSIRYVILYRLLFDQH